MLGVTIVFVLAIGFAFNWNKEREQKERILRALPENIKAIYLPKVSNG